MLLYVLLNLWVWSVSFFRIFVAGFQLFDIYFIFVLFFQKIYLKLDNDQANKIWLWVDKSTTYSLKNRRHTFWRSWLEPSFSSVFPTVCARQYSIRSIRANNGRISRTTISNRKPKNKPHQRLFSLSLFFFIWIFKESYGINWSFIFRSEISSSGVFLFLMINTTVFQTRIFKKYTKLTNYFERNL